MDKEKSDDVNIFFATIGERITSNNAPDEVGIRTITDHSQQQRIEDFTISQQQIKEMIDRKLKWIKSGGHDSASSKDLKLFGDFATEGLFQVMKRCKELSKFPPVWKVNEVKAIFKRGEAFEREGYRPISL